MDVEMFNRAAKATGDVVRNIGPDLMSAPTPCSEWSVRDVLGHLVENFRAVANDVAGQEAEGDAGSDLGDDPAATYDSATQRAAAILGEPGALEKTYKMPWGETPGQMLLGLAIGDTAVHGWDMAVATGQSYEIDEDIAEAVYAMTSGMMEPHGSWPRGDTFGPPVEVPDDASATDRAVAYLGRDPKAASG